MNEYIATMLKERKISKAEHAFMQKIFSEAKELVKWVDDAHLSKDARDILYTALRDMF